MRVIDIHTHLLPKMDDGAPDLFTSMAMVALAKDAGTTDIVATPHANIIYSYDPDLIEQRIQELQKLVGAEPRIHRGCDFHLSFQNIRRAAREPRHYSINGLGYLLVEFPDVSPIQGVEQIFSTLRDAGLILIVTHPERNPHLSGDFERLSRWVNNGIYLQVTAQCLSGVGFGSGTARWCAQALEKGLVHFVASDGHDTCHRPPRLDHAKAFLEERFGEDYAELLLEVHPRAVIAGQLLATGPVIPARRRKKKWFYFKT